MTNKTNKLLSKINSFHIILLGCILGSLLILNSNNVNNQKAQLNLYKEKDALFNRILTKRKLEETPIVEDEGEYIIETEEVCSHASDKLIEYYKTSDLSKIDLDDGEIKCEDKDTDYMQALIGFFESFLKDKDTETATSNGNSGSNTGSGSGGSTGGGASGTLRNLMDSDTEENIKKYLPRVYAMLVFLGIAGLSFIGWIVCIICCCADCCWCPCCKKVSCKIPFFIFTYIFYGLVVAVCLYGVTQASKVFVGIADTECSLLQFFDVILYGEQKDPSQPRWIGIENVTFLLDELNTTLTDMKNDDLLVYLDDYMEEINVQRDNFKSELRTVHKKFYKPESNDPLDDFCVEFPTSLYIENTQEDPTTQHQFTNGNKYVLDIIPNFGKYTGAGFEPPNSGIALWNEEISHIDGVAEQSLNSAKTSFQNIINDKLEDILDALKKGRDELSKLRKPFDSVYDDMSDAMYEFSDQLDKNGKLTINLVFGALGFLNICLAVLILFICMCSGQSCVECDFCRCLFKFGTHIIWNVLAILMVLSFLLGSLLALFGRFGADLMSFVSYVVSEENFALNETAVLLNELKEGKDILHECIVGDGNLSSIFGLDGMTGDFDSINQVKRDIENHMREFNGLNEGRSSYHILRGELEKRTEFDKDTEIVGLGDYGEPIKRISLEKIIDLLNSKIDTSSHNEQWNKEGDKSFICDTTEGDPSSNLLHPWTCEPNKRKWINELANGEVKNYATIATNIIEKLKNANGTNGIRKDYYDVLDELNSDYSTYLNAYLDTLRFFDEVIGDIINALKKGIGDSDDSFSFLNGKFIKTNLKIILKYLKYSLGQDMYTVGICLMIVGCSLALSISSTILLIIIINIDLEEKKRKAGQITEIPNFPVSNDGGISEFKNY